MFEEHPNFQPPEDPTTRIWRYVNFPKFVDLIFRRSLFFATAAALGDPYEGSYPRANVELRKEWYGPYAEAIEEQSRGEKLRRLNSTLINCWHMNPGESAAMWQLYSGIGNGIALTSTYERLCASLKADQPIYVGMVRYLRYDTDPMPEGNLFDPFVHKRQSFAHERELRAVTERHLASGTVRTLDEEIAYKGDYISVDPATLIDRIHVAPSSPSWFLEVVREATRRFGVETDVLTSELDVPPTY